MNWLLGIVGAVFLIGFIIGIYRGAIRIAVSVATTIVTLVVVCFASPYVAELIETYTPVNEVIEEKVSSAITTAALTQLNGTEQTQDTTTSVGLTRERVERVLKAAGVDEEDLAEHGITIDDIVNGKVTSQDLAQYGISSSVLAGVSGASSDDSASDSLSDINIPSDIQGQAIEGADMPEVFKNLLQKNNNSDTYAELGVKTFAEYVGKYLSNLIIYLVSYVLTFLVVTLILRAIIFSLDIVADLPVLGFVNRLAGGVVGVLCAAIVVWIVFIIITLLYTTEAGRALYDTIQGEPYLKALYDYNPILNLAIFLK